MNEEKKTEDKRRPGRGAVEVRKRIWIRTSGGAVPVWKEPVDVQ